MDKKQTAVKLIIDKFNLLSDSDFKSWMLNHHDELIQMEREQIKEAYIAGDQGYYILEEIKEFAKDYYVETYGGHLVDTNEMIDHIGDANKMVELPQQEISDEEIDKAFKDTSERLLEYKEGLIDGAKWYREQLKK